jgi:heterodisulfide reductase subunit A
VDVKNQDKPAALIIGAGIAGIQAALDIADAGYQVYLVEREPSVGGRMSQLDKTFPTLDCSSCILTPKMVDVGRHPNIELLTHSEVEWVKQESGRFQARIRKKARSVDEDRCTGCGTCTENCIVRNIPYIDELVEAKE